MSLDPPLLAKARAAAQALHQGEAGIEPLRENHRTGLRALHAAGASLREIATALGLSHQRVHQLVQPQTVAAEKPARRGRAPAGGPRSRCTCCVCGGVGAAAATGYGSVCAPCRAAGQALLDGEGEGGDRGLRLVRRHQRPRCGACGRQPDAGEAFLAGAFGAMCRQCLDLKA